MSELSDRPVYQYTGPFTPSALQSALLDAGVSCLGATYTEETDGGVFTVQVICEVGTAQADVDAVVQTISAQDGGQIQGKVAP